MKTSHLSVFIFGLLLTGLVQAQAPESVPQIELISAETTMVDAEPMVIMEDIPTMHEDQECLGKMKNEYKGMNHECPMKKKMGYSHHSKGKFIIFKIFCGLGMLLFLFLGAIVVRKGWIIGGKCCGKVCKK